MEGSVGGGESQHKPVGLGQSHMVSGRRDVHILHTAVKPSRTPECNGTAFLQNLGR